MMELFTPEGYDPKKKCNGCGTDGLSSKLIPNTIYFKNIRKACCRHDYMYEVGTTIEDKNEADRAFLNNMIRIVNSVDKWWYPTALARRRAYKYYKAVKYFGASAFWDGKNA